MVADGDVLNQMGLEDLKFLLRGNRVKYTTHKNPAIIKMAK
jgi:hypothetical protein